MTRKEERGKKGEAGKSCLGAGVGRTPRMGGRWGHNSQLSCPMSRTRHFLKMQWKINPQFSSSETEIRKLLFLLSHRLRKFEETSQLTNYSSVAHSEVI